jgi:hypothetical protein
MPAKAAKQHLSTFFILVNSQIDDEKYKKRLKDAYTEFYKNVNDYLVNKSKTVGIKSISSQATVERGNKRFAYHLHALLRIEHTGKIHLNLEKMRGFFTLSVKNGESKVFLNVKFVNDPTFVISRYFKKEK